MGDVKAGDVVLVYEHVLFKPKTVSFYLKGKNADFITIGKRIWFSLKGMSHLLGKN